MHDLCSSTQTINGGFSRLFPNGVCIPSPILTSAGATTRQISSHLPNSNSKHASCKQPQVKASMRFAAQKDPKRRQGYIQNLGKSNKPEGTSHAKHTDYFRILPVIMSVTYLFTFIEYIDLTQEPDNPVVEYWMKDFQLYPSDKDGITGGKWLIDSIIMAGQKLLRMAHPNMGGLQPHLR